jgi:hypothetical protein
MAVSAVVEIAVRIKKKMNVILNFKINFIVKQRSYI